MAIKWQNIYVFISSTFNDMHAERDYLVKRVFPELQEWCEARKLRLVDIDLRWGVTEQDATHNKNVVNVCLRRIDECRPFFLCFLGQRYGWVPQAEDISTETYATYPSASRFAGKVSVTELEVLHAVISPLHGDKRNPNNPAWHYLPAQFSFFYYRDPSYLNQLPEDPPRLREIYADPPRTSSPLEALKLEMIPATGRPFRSYRATWQDATSDRTPELALPLVCPSSIPENIERWRTEWRRSAGIEVPGTAIPEEGPLAQRAHDFNSSMIRGRLGHFQLDQDDGPTCTLGQVITEDLKQAIIQSYPEHAETAQEDDLQQELDQHDEFLFSRGQGYIERPGVFDELDAYLHRSDDQRLFVLTAEGGMGKSALLARWLDRSMNGSFARETGTTFHYRFVGASDRSSSVDGLLRMLLREWQELHGKFEEQISDNPEKLRLAWPRLLEAAGRHGNLVLVLDGLNQLQTGLRDLAWLPDFLPTGVKFVVSFKRGEPDAESLYQRYATAENKILAGVPPFDREEDRRQLIDAYLWQYLKQLDELASRELLTFPGGRNPLFLKVVLSELRVFGAFAGLHDRIHRAFGDHPEAAFGGILERLENDPAYTALDATQAVRLIFGFLSHARRGLSGDELVDLLLRHYPWPVSDAEESRTQQVRDAVNLYLRQVRPFLARRAGRHDFFYESFKIAAARRYAAEPLDWHRCLAEHYERRARATSQGIVSAGFDVRVVFDVEAALQDRWITSLTEKLFNPAAGDESLSAEQESDFTQMLVSMQQPFMELLRLDMYASTNLTIKLYEQGSCVVAQRLPRERAELLAAQFIARGIDAHIEIAAAEKPSSWPSSDPHPYSELLFHQVEARLWSAHVSVLSDDTFRSRCMKFFGPSHFIDCFHEFLRTTYRDEAARSQLNELRLRMPINDYTQPLLAALTDGFQRDPTDAATFLLACARDPAEQGRAIIPLRAMEQPGFISCDEQSPAVRRILSEALPLLLCSTDKHVRWHAVHSYWVLAQRDEWSLLLKAAEAESEHLLVRAEAARQLGEVDDAEVAARLLKLAETSLYPLNAMANRSARLIQQSLRLVDPQPVDDWRQPTVLPDDLAAFLDSLGVDSQMVDLTSYGEQSRLLVNLVLCSAMSVETRWHEVEALYKIFRSTPCHLVCSEAGSRDCSLTHLKQIAGKEVWQRVALRYFHDFMLGSEEYLQLTSEYPFSIQGVDDMSTYVSAMDAKQKGLQGLEFAASVTRAREMLKNTLKHMDRIGAKAAVLITQELPGYQISRLLGEDQQYDSQVAREASGPDSATFMGNSFIESMLPDHVTPEMVVKPDNLIYVMVRMKEPQGDIFGMDINFVHSLSGSLNQPASRKNDSGTPALNEKASPAAPPPLDLRKAELSRAVMLRANLRAADLSDANLEDARLRGANLSKAKLEGTHLRGANLFHVSLSESNLHKACLERANLHDACLNAANLTGAYLNQAILIGASLKEANLEHADLTGADLRDADLTGTRMTGAELSEAVFTGARYDSKTVWPTDFRVFGRGLLLSDPPINLNIPAGGEAGLEVANLAVIARNRGEQDRADRLEAEALAIWERCFGDASIDLAVCLNSYLRALQTGDHHAHAVPLGYRAVQIWEQPRIEAAWLSTSLNNLGLSLFRTNEIIAAEQHLLRAATVDPNTPAPHYWLALLYQSRANFDRESAAWQAYLDLGAPIEQRRREAVARLEQLKGES
ncbi:MAG: pentapeptide repeat-containing protein [Planctomycetaceae bacterium]